MGVKHLMRLSRTAIIHEVLMKRRNLWPNVDRVLTHGAHYFGTEYMLWELRRFLISMVIHDAFIVLMRKELLWLLLSVILFRRLAVSRPLLDQIQLFRRLFGLWLLLWVLSKSHSVIFLNWAIREPKLIINRGRPDEHQRGFLLGYSQWSVLLE